MIMEDKKEEKEREVHKSKTHDLSDVVFPLIKDEKSKRISETNLRYPSYEQISKKLKVCFNITF
jgi:hypothetical protein